MATSPDLARALLDVLDEDALDELAERLAPRLAGRLDGGRREPDGWMTTAQAAEYLGLSRAALHRLTASRRIPFEQALAGGKCWFRRSELDRWRQGGAP